MLIRFLAPFLGKFIEKNLKKKKKIKRRKIPQTQKIVFFLKCMWRHGILRVLCRSVCWFLYGPFCHGALKLDISTLFTTFFL